MSQHPSSAPMAHFAGVTARGLQEVATDLRVLDGGGRWAVAATFEGGVVAARFSDWSAGPPSPDEIGGYEPPTGVWRDSLPRKGYEAGVARIREGIARGDFYQVNLCRVLSAPLPGERDPAALWRILQAGNPAPYGGFMRLPQAHIVSASPELFLRRDADLLESGPIKGTARTRDGFSDKDRAENVMIVDLVRNDLGRVSRTGSVSVPALMAVEEHPGLFHLVSYVAGHLLPATSWSDIFDALFPPGSVVGAPKLAALDSIRELEPTVRGPYCGAFGWVDADKGTAKLAVSIRTFWFDEGRIHFGTGAGITWSSDPVGEWQETELKASRLVALASGGRGQP